MNNLKVNCYSGHTYAERPESFRWQGIEHNVEEIEKAWLEPGERHFQVRTGDNKIFRLCYNEVEQHWSLIEPGGGQKDEGNSKNTAK
ncbi:hypothetical protein ACFLXO_05210 [Chloroflexota bacterium]